MNPKLILSLTTYPGRWEYLNKTLISIVGQTFYDKVDLFYINIDDNLSDDDVKRYESLKNLSDKIRIKICDYRWKSANKLVWVYKDHPDDIIVCFDDDKTYPRECLEQLYRKWEEHPNCIVAQEINPIVKKENGHVEYLNTIDCMLNQIEYGKYLSNGCLFCPNAFSDLLFSYDDMMYTTNGKHDELWFWLVSTLNGTPCIGLDYTYSWCLDENVCFESTSGDLTNINNDPQTIQGYNDRINERFGKELDKITSENPVKFFVSHSNIMAILGNIGHIHQLYGNFPIDMMCDRSVVLSWVKILQYRANMFKWKKFNINLSRDV